MMMTEPKEMSLHPSKIPTGTVLSARHHVTNSMNRVKVGRVFIGKTPRETIRQPVYLRKGLGVFLRKCLTPRRNVYGAPPPERLEYLQVSEEEEEEEEEEEMSVDSEGVEAASGGGYSWSLQRALYTPGVIMTTQPIRLCQLNPQLLRLFRRLPASSVPPEDRKAIQAELERRPSLKRIVMRNPESRRMLGPLINPLPGPFQDYDGERKPPPPYSTFTPPPPLPGPEYYALDSEASEYYYYFTDQPTLRRRDVPVIEVPPSPSPSSSSISSISSVSMEEYKVKCARLRERRCGMAPEFVPRVVPAGSAASEAAAAAAPPVKVTSSRVQQGLVTLGDLFPYRAEQGLLAEIDFYQQDRNFPLLLNRNEHVDLETFNALNPVRILSPERVVTVNALAKRVARQRPLVEALKRTDSDLEVEGATCLEDNVFNPLTYPLNVPVYKDVEEWTTAKKL